MHDFKARKQAGRIEIVEVFSRELVVNIKQYDPLTGEETGKTEERLNKAELIERKQALEKELTDINDVLSVFE